MKTKTIIASAFIALTALASCNKSEVVSDSRKAISFNASNYSSVDTRANVKTTANLEKFGVFAKTDNNASLIDNKVAAKQQTTNTYYSFKPSEYWPSNRDEIVSFYAFAPETTDASFWDKDSKSFKDVKPAAKLEDQNDILYAFNTASYNTTNSGVDPVDLNFHHILSSIDIQVKNSHDQYTVILKGAKIVYVNSKGSFKPVEAKTTTTTRDETLGNWNVTKDGEEVYYNTLETVKEVSKTDYETILGGNNYMLLPQTIDKWELTTNKANTDKKAYLALLIQIKNGDQFMYPKHATDGKFGYTAIPLVGGSNTNDKWELGKKYTYHINFFGNGGAGHQDPNPDTTPGDQTDDTDKDDPGVDKGDPILGAEIKFTPNVLNYVDGDVIEINL